MAKVFGARRLRRVVPAACGRAASGVWPGGRASVTLHAMTHARTILCLGLLASLLASAAAAAADPLSLRAGPVTYVVDPATLKIDARPDGAAPVAVMPPLHAPEAAAVTRQGAGWGWTDAEGRKVGLSTEGEALRLTISGPGGSRLAWPLP